MNRQLALKVGLSDLASFDNFYAGANREAVSAIRAAAAGRPGSLFVYGPAGTGKSHLLYAAVKDAQSRARSALYLSRAAADAGTVDWLDLPGDGLICIDDAGERLAPAEAAAWVSLYERIRARSGSLIVSARRPPADIDWAMPDLRSRLQSDLVYRLAALGERELEEALRLRAGQRGLYLSDEVMRFVLRRYERSPVSLFRLLDRIDLESLARKRRITVPFLRALELESE